MACIVSLKPHTVELAVDAHGRLKRGQGVEALHPKPESLHEVDAGASEAADEVYM